MAAPRPWTVLPHGPFERLTENVWTVDGALPRGPLRRRMTVVRLGDGRLVVHNAIALEESAMRELEAWGEPAMIVVPNAFHRLDGPAWKARYPKSTVWCPAGAEKRVAEAVRVDGVYSSFPRVEGLTVAHLDGVRPMLDEGVFTARDAAGRAALIFNDALFNHPHVPGAEGLVLRVMRSSGGPRVTPLFRTVGVGDRAQFGAHLRHLAAMEGLSHLVPGHGVPVSLDAPGVLRQVAEQVAPS